ncbi:hypothetical protein M405DRAFT_19531 [Rhizopogon salebrosus TDB-379]|nr:hypothetical protein M405DRAFT_19531 [Rhizopogon salebrosus TDB-379]
MHDHLMHSSLDYQPSVGDVVAVKQHLQSKLPTELVDRIIEDASYWPHSSISLERPFVVSFFKDGRMAEDGMYMGTLPIGIHGAEGDHKLLPEDFCQDGAAWTAALALGEPDDHSWSAPTLLRPCRKIEFQFWSSAQGWGGEPEPRGTYSGSYTWFDAGIYESHTPIFANNTIQWPTHLVFRGVDQELLRIQRDITKPGHCASGKRCGEGRCDEAHDCLALPRLL